MPDDGSELRRIHWVEAFPFVRLFTAASRALAWWPLVLGLACVLYAYVAGRLMDAIWTAAGRTVVIVPGALPFSEIDAFASTRSDDFGIWRTQQTEQLSRLRQQAEQAQANTPKTRIAEARRLVDARLDAARKALASDASRSKTEAARARLELERAADVLRFELAGRDVSAFREDVRSTAIDRLWSADTSLEAAARNEQTTLVRGAVEAARVRGDYQRVARRGPFVSLLDYELRCAAAAVRGVAHGRMGFGGAVSSGDTGLLGAIAAGGSGLLWLVTHHLWFAVLFGLLLLVGWALLGGGLCRYAAVFSAREETIPIRTALGFSREKLVALVGGPLGLVVIFLVAAALLFVGGLVGAIPWIGPILAGLFYILAILGGLALALCVVAAVLGFPLMWPTIAVEGSDGFDAVQRGAGYVFQRPWHAGFYALVLAICGGIALLVLRIVAMLVLKLTHAASGAGMSFFGSWSSAETDTVRRLDAMWYMPAWQDLPWLPSANGPNFWGDLFGGPLSGAETVGAFLIAVWVFLVVCLVGGYAISFFFTGAVEAYYLLRRNVDSVDYNEIYYEEGLAESYGTSEAPAEPPPPEPNGGTSLPIVTPPQA